MLLIRQSEAAVQVLDTDMRQRVDNLFQELQEFGPHWKPDELGWLAVWGDGDDPYDKGLFLGIRNLLQSPYDPDVSFETVQDHGHYYEAVILLSDLVSVSVLIPKELKLPPALCMQLSRFSSD